MYCSKCGSQVADNAAFCGSCGQRLAGPALPPPAAAMPPVATAPPAPQYGSPQIPQTPPTAPGGAYIPPRQPGATWSAAPGASAPAIFVPARSPFAGFWLRFVAYIIDTLLILVAFGVVVVVIVAFVGAGVFENAFENADDADQFLPFAVVMSLVVACFILIAGVWIYYAWMESSSHQGTLGKLSLGLIVTDLQGRRISFARATGRFFSRFITRLIPFWIGYIMAGFTEKKQALHDMIASTLVLRKS